MRRLFHLAGQRCKAGTHCLPGALLAFVPGVVGGAAGFESPGFAWLLPQALVLLLALLPLCADLARLLRRRPSLVARFF
jgi:hypothetical protein